MKKILALVLALVMTLSLATISSGAAFTDADKIQYVDAVDTLAALGVVNGRTNGSFDPQGDVTRGAAAKMVALVATATNKTIVSYYAGTSSFADVPATHTFADVVAYCVGKGIVDGYGDGTYGVADNVKGWAVAKMVLVAMGYDAEAFGLTGTGAALRTIELATTEGLFDNMKSDFVATEPASREECAQIIYNALDEVIMEKSGLLNGVPVYAKDEDGATLMSKYGDGIVTGIVEKNAATGADATYVDGVDLTNATGLDMIGHEVWYYVDSSVEETEEGAETAYAIVDRSYEVVVSAAEAGDAMDEDAFKAKFGATEVADNGAVVEFANYAPVVAELVDDEEEAGYALPEVGAVNAGTYVFNAAGVIVSYLAPSEYEVTYVVDYAAVDGETDGSLVLGTRSWTIDAEDGAPVSYYADIAVGDAVAVQQTGELFTVTKLATVTGKVSQYDTTEGKESITVGGKAYSFSAVGDETDINVTSFTGETLMFADVLLYLDLDGAVVAVADVPGAEAAVGPVVYVVAGYDIEVADTTDKYGESNEDGTTLYYAQCVDMSGKEVSYQVTEEYYASIEAGLAVVSTTVVEGVTYATFDDSYDADEDNFKIETAGDVEAGKMKIDTYDYYASDVKFIYVSGSLKDLKVEVLDGGKAVASGSEYYATKIGTSANYSVKYVVLAGPYTAGNVENDDIVYVAADSDSQTYRGYTDAEGATQLAYVHNVYVNGALKEVVSVDQYLGEGFYYYSVDEYGNYDFDTETEVVNAEEDLVTGNLYGTLLTIGEVEDVEGKNAKIVDVEFANMDAATKTATGAKEIKDVKELAAGTEVAVVFNTNAAGTEVTEWVTIYVIARPVEA